MNLLSQACDFLMRRRRSGASIRYSPYRTDDSGCDLELLMHTLRNVRAIYGERGWLENFSAYQALIARLRDMPDTVVVPVKEMMHTPADHCRVLSLRYDIDADPYTAIRLARYNARYGLCGSFYILHTAFYYGQVHSGVMHRSPLVSSWITDLIVAGAEIGLHLDPLSLYFEHGIDGADAVRQELQWLRSQGTVIEGTVSHNSLPVYGAENFEIFRDRLVWKRSSVQRNGIRVPLGVLDEEALGLTYEANFASSVSDRPSHEARRWLSASTVDAVHNEKWMRSYLGNCCYRRKYEVGVWHHGGGRWTLTAELPDGRIAWLWKTSLDQVMDRLEELPVGIRGVVILHPIFFAADAPAPFSSLPPST